MVCWAPAVPLVPPDEPPELAGVVGARPVTLLVGAGVTTGAGRDEWVATGLAVGVGTGAEGVDETG